MRAAGEGQAASFTGRYLPENLSPDGGDHPNPEYPWSSSGVITAPVEYPFPDLNLQSPKMLKLLRFIAICFTLAH